MMIRDDFNTERGHKREVRRNSKHNLGLFLYIVFLQCFYTYFVCNNLYVKWKQMENM